MIFKMCFAAIFSPFAEGKNGGARAQKRGVNGGV